MSDGRRTDLTTANIDSSLCVARQAVDHMYGEWIREISNLSDTGLIPEDTIRRSLIQKQTLLSELSVISLSYHAAPVHMVEWTSKRMVEFCNKVGHINETFIEFRTREMPRMLKHRAAQLEEKARLHAPPPAPRPWWKFWG